MGTWVLLAGSCRVCGPAGPGVRVRRWKPLPALPAGLTLAPPGAARQPRSCTLCRCSNPGPSRPGARPSLEKPWGLGVRKSRDRTPKLGATPDFDGPAPSGPLGGELTLPEGPALARSVLGRPSCFLRAAGGIYAVQDSQLTLARFQLRAKACAHPSRGCVEVMPINETKINSRYYKTK